MTAHPPATLPAPADTPAGPEPTRHAAPATIPAPDAATLPHDRPLHHRSDGWTPERQRLFVEGIAGGDTVDRACARVALSPASAYAFRRRAAGAAFALAWDGARLLARETLADVLLTRALEGQEEVITRPDGSVVTRHRFDNRLATHMLHRLDRFSDAASHSAHGTAARAVAGEFDAYLDLIDADATPARAGLFVAERLDPRLTASDAPAQPAALEPVLALARADRWLAGHPATAAEVDVSDLDPATRARWTAGQWARAEAAGLLSLAPAHAPARDCQLSQLPPGITPYVSPADRPEPVWWCDHADAWRTRFPRPTTSSAKSMATGATPTTNANSTRTSSTRSRHPRASTPPSATSPKPAPATNGSPGSPARRSITMPNPTRRNPAPTRPSRPPQLPSQTSRSQRTRPVPPPHPRTAPRPIGRGNAPTTPDPTHARRCLPPRHVSNRSTAHRPIGSPPPIAPAPTSPPTLRASRSTLPDPPSTVRTRPTPSRPDAVPTASTTARRTSAAAAGHRGDAARDGGKDPGNDALPAAVRERLPCPAVDSRMAQDNPATRRSANRKPADKPVKKTSGIAVAAGIGAVAAGLFGALRFGLFDKLLASRPAAGEHPAPDLKPSAPTPGTTRAPVDFRPDPTAAVPASEREALRPATGPAPTLAATRGEVANQTGAAN